jgi:hypothetical protein
VYRGNQIFRRSIMRDVPGNSCFGTGQDVSLEFPDGESDNGQRWKNLSRSPSYLQAIAYRKVEQQNIRVQACDLVEEVAGPACPNHAQAALQDRGKPVPI